MRTISDGASITSKAANKTGVTGAINVFRPGVEGVTGNISAAVDAGQKLAVKHVVEPVLGDTARASHKWAIEHLQKYRKLKPNFVKGAPPPTANTISVSPAGRDAASGNFPYRMFNLQTRNLETMWFGRPLKDLKYAILSHGWKGAEIEYTDIMELKEKAKEMDIMNPDQPRYPHLQLQSEEAGDVDMLVQHYEHKMEELRQARKDPPSKAPLTSEENLIAEKRRSAYKILHSLETAYSLFQEQEREAMRLEEKNNRGSGKPKKTISKPKNLYLWNDTCCINKGVVNEHANSLALMGEWYTNAEFCVVHLDYGKHEEDWDAEFEEGVTGKFDVKAEHNKALYKDLDSILAKSKVPYWATRGWTLQELCLSRDVAFFNNRWERIPADMSSYNDKACIAKFCKVPQSEVCRGRAPSEVSAFELLGFASKRDCTLDVDRIYSMMGMLDVKFSVFYAEGMTKALTRLLDEVIITKHDVSIFNWDGELSGNTIPGRSLYPVNLVPFTKDSRTIRANAQAVPGSAHFPTIANEGNQDPEQDRGPKEVVKHALRLIDKHLDRFAHFITKKDYDELPQSAIQKILEYTRKARFGKNITYEYDLVKRILLFIERADEKARLRAKESLKSKLTEEGNPLETASSAPMSPPPPYTQAEPAAASPSPASGGSYFDGIPSVPSLSGSSMFGRGKKKDKENKEKPVEKPSPPPKEKSSMFSSSRFKIGGDSSKDKAVSIQGEEVRPSTPGAGADKQPSVTVDPKWFTLVENVISYLTSILQLSESTGPQFKDPFKDARLKCIGYILDHLHPVQPSGPMPDMIALDFTSERDGARYLDQIIANRALCYVITAKDPRESEAYGNMKEVLHYIQRTDFQSLSPALITDLFTLLNKTAFCACPKYADIVEIHGRYGDKIPPSGSRESRRPKSLHGGHDDDEDDLEHLPPPIISRNPIIVSTSGIEGLFDIQRVIVDIIDAGKTSKIEPRADQVSKPLPTEMYACSSDNITASPLYIKIMESISKGNLDETFTGHCKISTGLGHITIRYCCTASVLKKQLDIRDILSQTELKPTEDPTAVVPGPDVMTMLQFVKEADIELVAGEWVLARFAGVPGANWFLCLLELGATHPFYGWRIPTESIDFTMGTPEQSLVDLWEKYMERKKNYLCDLVDTRIKQRKVALQKKVTQLVREKNPAGIINAGLDVMGDFVTNDSTSTVEAIGRGLDKIGKIAGTEVIHAKTRIDQHNLKTQEYRERIDLRFKALEDAGVPKETHMAVLSLDDNSVLPAMFFPAKKIHMF